MSVPHPQNQSHMTTRLETFGAHVRRERKSQGLNQTELAEHVDISRTYLSQIEQGRAQNLSLRLASDLSEVLGIPSPYEESESEGKSLDVPKSLRDFAKEDEIPEGDVQMLAKIEYRGTRPDSVEKWRMLYSVIQASSK